MRRNVLLGIGLVTLMVAMIPLVASQMVVAEDIPVAPAVFSDKIVENMELYYKITDLEFVGGATSGSAAIGYQGTHRFSGYNKTVAENDIIYIKVDTRTAAWENSSQDTTMIYSGWDFGVIGWGPICNVTLFSGGNAPANGSWYMYELDPIFSRICLFPTYQLLVYEPQDGADYSEHMNPMFGDWDDNGTIDPGTWTGTGYALSTDVDYNPNSTWYKYLDAIGPYYGYDVEDYIYQVSFNKIPATFANGTSWFDETVTTTYAHWNYSFYDMAYTLYNAGYVRWQSWAYADGYFENNQLLPYINVVTDIKTGITTEYEFDFGPHSAWDNAPGSWGNTMLETQITKMKVELVNITYPPVPPGPVPGFEIVTVAFVGIVLGAALVQLRKRK